MDLRDQTACRERVKVLELMEELQRLRTLREKREYKARCAQYATYTVAVRDGVRETGEAAYKDAEDGTAVIVD